MAHGIAKIDHVAITASDFDVTLEFYQTVLGATVVKEHEIDGRISIAQLLVGGAMMNIHRAGHSYSLVAAKPTPGAADLCFRWSGPIESAVDTVTAADVEVFKGPVERLCSDLLVGQSIYFRDPDGNLIELLSTFLSDA